MLRQLSSHLRSIDIFGKQVMLNFREDNLIRTPFGGLLAIIVVITVLAFCFSKASLFLQKGTILVQTNRVYDDFPSDVKMDSTNFMVGVNIQQSNFTTNPYYNITMQQRLYIKEANGTRIKQITDVPMEPCTYSHWGNLNNIDGEIITPDKFVFYQLNNYLCPKLGSNFTVGGQYEGEFFYHIKFIVTDCVNATSSSIDSDSTRILWNPTCHSKEDVASFVDSTPVRVQFQIANFNVNPTLKNPISKFISSDIFFQIQPGYMYRTADIYFSEYDLQSDESLIPVKDIKSTKMVVQENRDYREQTIFSDESPYATFYFNRSRYSTKVSRSYTKVDDIISSIGGFVQSVMVVAAVLVQFYNEEYFKLELANQIYDFDLKENDDDSDKKVNRTFNRQNAIRRHTLNAISRLKHLTQNKATSSQLGQPHPLNSEQRSDSVKIDQLQPTIVSQKEQQQQLHEQPTEFEEKFKQNRSQQHKNTMNQNKKLDPSNGQMQSGNEMKNVEEVDEESSSINKKAGAGLKRQLQTQDIEQKQIKYPNIISKPSKESDTSLHVENEHQFNEMYNGDDNSHSQGLNSCDNNDEDDNDDIDDEHIHHDPDMNSEYNCTSKNHITPHLTNKLYKSSQQKSLVELNMKDFHVDSVVEMSNIIQNSNVTVTQNRQEGIVTSLKNVPKAIAINLKPISSSNQSQPPRYIEPNYMLSSRNSNTHILMTNSSITSNSPIHSIARNHNIHDEDSIQDYFPIGSYRTNQSISQPRHLFQQRTRTSTRHHSHKPQTSEFGSFNKMNFQTKGKPQTLSSLPQIKQEENDESDCADQSVKEQDIQSQRMKSMSLASQHDPQSNNEEIAILHQDKNPNSPSFMGGKSNKDRVESNNNHNNKESDNRVNNNEKMETKKKEIQNEGRDAEHAGFLEAYQEQMRRDYLNREFKKQQKRRSKLHMSIQYFIFKLSCGKFYDTKENRMISHAHLFLKKDTDIIEIVKKIKELEKLKSLILNNSQLVLFDHFPKPVLSIDPLTNTIVKYEQKLKEARRFAHRCKQMNIKPELVGIVKKVRDKFKSILIKRKKLFASSKTLYYLSAVQKSPIAQTQESNFKLFQAYERLLQQKERSRKDEILIHMLGVECKQLLKDSYEMKFGTEKLKYLMSRQSIKLDELKQ